jgi:hypothetical protein
MGSRVILLFEDSSAKAQQISQAIQAGLLRLGDNLTKVTVFADIPRVGGTFDDELRKLIKDGHFGDVCLIVTDRDLSNTSDWRGLSEITISGVGDQLGIPVCLYATGVEGDLSERIHEWKGQKLVFENGGDPASIAESSVVAFLGFEQIRSKLETLREDISLQKQGVATFMAAVLGRRELAPLFSSYLRGGHRALSTVLENKDPATANQRLATFLGLWLWDTILRFPGILVNEVAAASYLDLDFDTFSRPEIQAIISGAAYEGPFHQLQKFWWRTDLERCYIVEGFETFKDLCRSRIPDVPLQGSKCIIDPARPAGYYCIKNKQAISKENSVGAISWLPAGADLSRIAKPDYDLLSPWLGI